MKGRHRPK